MRAREFVSESRVGSLQDDVADALPSTFVFPELENTDPYKQYRFGVAIAAAKRLSQEDPLNIENYKDEFAPQSAWGENLVVVTYEQEQDTRILDLASKLMGVSKHQISTTKSQETKHVYTRSPITPIK